MAGRSPTREVTEERFWARVEKTDSCWLWTGAKTDKGYGHLYVKKIHTYAHVFAYELLVGPIPQGLELDHVKKNGCTSTLCVKVLPDENGPAHLEAVTHRENMLRTQRIADQISKTHCPKNHPYSGDNLVVRRGKRECRLCINERQRNH